MLKGVANDMKEIRIGGKQKTPDGQRRGQIED